MCTGQLLSHRIVQVGDIGRALKLFAASSEKEADHERAYGIDQATNRHRVGA